MYDIKFYTSYFPKVAKLGNMDILPISICAKCPDWYAGYQYKKLAPTWDILKQWKGIHDTDLYKERFGHEVLDTLDFISVLCELLEIAYSNDACAIAMLCYERPNDFCHRHLVADWFISNGIACEEIIC